LSTWPGRPGWSFAAAQALWLFPLVGAFAWFGGFLTWRPALGATTWTLLAVALAFPALAEEMLFRVVLIPLAPERRLPLVVLALFLFVIWHPLQSLLYRVPWADLALSPWFLAAVAALGIACSRIWIRTHSIWPCVVLHWSVVALWKALFAAPLFFPHP
jgi:predicted Abi (CAAX) family protease